MTILVLPYPISANRYWRSFVPKGWTRAVVHLSDEAKAYKTQVAWLARAAGFKEPTSKPISLTLVLCPRRTNADGKVIGVTMDLSNCLKIAEDALQGIVYENDRQVRELWLRYGEKTEKGQLIVEIKEFIPAPAPLFAEAAA